VISDVLIYTSHGDPQLRGNAALMIGRFIRAVLGEGRGSWDNWMATLHPAIMSSMLTLFCSMLVFDVHNFNGDYFCSHMWIFSHACGIPYSKHQLCVICCIRYAASSDFFNASKLDSYCLLEGSCETFLTKENHIGTLHGLGNWNSLFS